MDKLRMQSTNGVQENIEKIQSLFPDCVTETIDERTGELVRKVDFEKLQQNLSDVIISGREERYQFTWPDKKKAILLANSPVNAALRPCREESVDFDNTQNLYIEGDNLDVLKCLKETYLHKVKMILRSLLPNISPTPGSLTSRATVSLPTPKAMAASTPTGST